MSGPRLSDQGVRRARARAQRLSDPAFDSDVAAVVAAVGGIQAQDGQAAALAIRARSRGLTAADVDTALTDERSVVLTWTLRGTRHLHHRDDVRWMVALLGPVFARPTRRHEQLGIAGDKGERAVEALRKALEAEGPLTRQEVKDHVARLGVDPSGQAPVHVIHQAALRGLLCVVPQRGREERYVLMEDWLPDPPSAPPDPGAALARRYLAAYGPATPDDFAVWSGLGKPAARAAWQACGIAGELTEVTTARGPAWLLADQLNDARDATHQPSGLRMLGAFDTLLLGYADRSLLVPTGHARQINPGGGMVRPVLLSDGEVIATWRRADRGRTLDLNPFRPLSRTENTALDAERSDVARFLAAS